MPIRLLLTLLLALGLPFLPQAQTLPPREVRAAWISTVENLDWPPRPGMRPREQRAALSGMLDSLRALGINTVFLQIRPASDAFYRSRLEPWSGWLQGRTGVSPGYDPLRFASKACRKRGMELHAWFNPFRVSQRGYPQAAKPQRTLARRQPQWLLSYGSALVVDPGIPEARDYIVSVVLDVARRYDLDGIHLDDYFYPYPLPRQAFPDTASFRRYGNGMALGDWRRQNIDALIRGLSQELAHAKPLLKFGVSPFGVWRNQAQDPLGSPTQAGMPSYDSIYADTRGWLRQGWIDYVVPQLYWSMDFKPAAFRPLLQWWASNSFGRQVYAGHAAYKVMNNFDKAWQDPEELGRQLDWVREHRGQVQGSAFFRAKFLLEGPESIREALKRRYAAPALPPALPWKSGQAPGAPRRLQSRNGALRWKHPATGKPAYYALYRAGEDGRTVLAAVLAGNSRRWADPQPGAGRYLLQALNAQWHASEWVAPQ
jgi:uncharacterized lipoprotein YddW (UPF0748 family)